MHGFRLKAETDRTPQEHMKAIIQHRAALVEDYQRLIVSFDEADASKWAQIIAAAREAGLTKEALCHEFSCSWSTILRWEAGRNAPGPFARRAMKEKLLEMLGTLHKLELRRSKELVPA
jgi:ribosome-binding protein aMBF1 (putative translation factor)